MDRSQDESDGLAIILFTLALWLALISAWITHLVWSIGVLASEKGATISQMVLAAIGAFMPPVGMVHGLMIWFGAGL